MCHLPIYPRPNNCYPSPRLFPRPEGWLNRDRRHHGNLPDQNVGTNGWRVFPFCPRASKGHVIDLNNNGRYDQGRDGVLVFDHNRDGKYDQNDVENTNKMMKAASGNYDFDGDGRVSCHERRLGRHYSKRFRQLDRNRDGRLDTREISAGGGKVWVDHRRDGKIGCGELHSPYRIPGGFFEPNGRRLDYVDPIWGSGTSTNSPWWQRPRCGCLRPQIFFGGGGYGG